MKVNIEATLHFRNSSLVLPGGVPGVERPAGSFLFGLLEEQLVKLKVHDSVEIDVFYTLGNTTLTYSGEHNTLTEYLTEWDSKDDSESSLLNYLQETSSGIYIFIWVNFNKNVVYVARDTFGQIPIYVSFSPGHFCAFSTDISYLRNIPGEEPEIDKNTVINYLFNKENGRAYSGRTFYRNLYTLLPGTLNCFSGKEHTTHFYLNFKLQKWADLKTIEAFGSEHRRLYTKSVSVSTSSSVSTGAHLSGGLDSSSNVCMFGKLYPEKEINTFFHKTGTRKTEESFFVNEVLSHVNARHHILIPSTLHLESMIKMIRITGQPITMVNTPAKHLEGMQLVKDTGCDTLLTGNGGDNVVGYGYPYIEGVISERDWVELNKIMKAFVHNDLLSSLDDNWSSLDSGARYQLIARGYSRKVTKNFLKSHDLAGYVKFLFAAKKYFNVPVRQVLEANVKDLAKSILLNRRLSPSNFILGTTRLPVSPGVKSDGMAEIHSQNYPYDLLYHSLVRVVEELFALGHHFDINIRHPFLSPELYELSLSVPEKLKFGNGLLRGHHREGMKGVLPESVRLRTGKAIFDDYEYKTIKELYVQAGDFLEGGSPIWDYVDRKHFEKVTKALNSNKKEIPSRTRSNLSSSVYRVINLAVWLNLLKSKTL